MTTPALAFAKTHQDRFIQELREYLRIPSVSTLTEHHDDVRHAAAWIAKHLDGIGLDHAQVIEGEENPFVYADQLGQPGAETILIYGHYDCQPTDPRELWTRDPFSADLEDGVIWARGASDNKAQHFAHIKALECLMAANGKLPLNVKLLLEGEEEIGSPNIETFVRANRRLLAADSGVISDGAMFAPDQPSLDYGLRGIAAFEIQVRGPGRDLHSGSYGGTVLNPALALTQMLSQLHDSEGRIQIPGFYEDVRPITAEERELLGRAGYSVEQWQHETGAAIPWGEPDFELLERIGARPTCEINGLWGGFAGEGVKTIIPAQAGAKISMRLVPFQDPERVADQFKAFIRSIAPAEVEVSVQAYASCWPALMPIESDQVQAAAAALKATWGVEPVFTRGGGSLPVVAAFQQALDAPFVLIPIGLDDNRHSPNEHIRVEYFEKGIEMAIRFYENLAGL
jgi:acetylornithine deacetylase/succinyl-diaminopimelate desuccinylase-like protein